MNKVEKALIACFAAAIMIAVPLTTMGRSTIDPNNVVIQEKIRSYSVVTSVDGVSSEVGDIDLTQEEIKLILQTSTAARNELSKLKEYGADLDVEEVLLVSNDGNIQATLSVAVQPMMVAGMGFGCSVLLASIIAMAILVLALGIASIPLGDIAGWIAFFSAGGFFGWGMILAKAYQDLGCEFPIAASNSDLVPSPSPTSSLAGECPCNR